MSSPLFRPVALLAATLALGACTTYDQGYSRVGVSYGYGSYAPYYGWYDGFYYPGTGYYIYDRYGSRHRWSDSHRRYWEGRRGGRHVRDNWSGYRREARPNNRPRDPNRSDWGWNATPPSQTSRPQANRPRAENRREARNPRTENRREARNPRNDNRGERPGWRTRPRD